MSGHHRAAPDADRAPAPPARVDDGTLEAVKWLALLLMTLDHVNTFVHGRSLPWAYEAGRVAMPLFALVLAYNLARPGAHAARQRTMARLLGYGLLATPPFMLLIGRALPLNILLTLLVAAAVIHLLDRGGAGRLLAAFALLAGGGALVEFHAWGVVLCVVAWLYWRDGGVLPLLALVAATAGLHPVNGNFWALAALPVWFAMQRLRLRVPRVPHLFYLYYPAHLVVLLALRPAAG